jgi:8-oxo-dGTP pyrophosphatase MutT (NUDIX family)
MAKKQNKVVQLAEFREPNRADHGERMSEARGTTFGPETLRRTRRGGEQSGRHWTFKGWTAPSPFLAEMMRSPITAPPLLRGAPMLESGALAYRRLKNGELLILLVSKKRSKKWGIPKGKVNASLSFGETAAKEAFEEAGVIGRVSPNSIGMFRAKKGTPTPKNIEVWVYLLEVDEMLSNWPEKEKRQTRWVSCKVAARELREPVLTDLCHHLAQSSNCSRGLVRKARPKAGSDPA